MSDPYASLMMKGKKMNYQEIYKAIADNHADHFGGEYAEMLESDKRIMLLEQEFPELFAKAQEDFNNYLRSL